MVANVYLNFYENEKNYNNIFLRNDDVVICVGPVRGGQS